MKQIILVRFLNLRLLVGLTALLCVEAAMGQSALQPGFDSREYLRLLNFQVLFGENAKATGDPAFTRVYLSQEGPLFNKWALWLRNDSVAAIQIRGTIGQGASWLENFYAAMIPAKGSLRLSDSVRFDYTLAADPDALVHVGWTLGLAHIAPTVVEQINIWYRKGVRDFYIFGHSQGGALAFLLRSYLHYLPEGTIPKDIRIKTYCSAAPKPGNLKYAYDFDFITRNGWAYRVVNTSDWVPETPFSIQRTTDINPLNPLNNRRNALSRQPFFVRLYLNRVYNKLDRSSTRATRRFSKYLGHTLYKQVKKFIPGFAEPEYVESMNYMTAGSPVILAPNAAYHERFREDGKNVFLHHLLDPYRFLIEEIYGE